MAVVPARLVARWRAQINPALRLGAKAEAIVSREHGGSCEEVDPVFQRPPQDCRKLFDRQWTFLDIQPQVISRAGVRGWPAKAFEMNQCASWPKG